MPPTVRNVAEDLSDLTLVEQLERRAREVVGSSTRLVGGFSPASFIEDEIALRLDQIDRTRRRWEQMGESLTQAECYIETELMQMEQRTPRYSPYRYPEREKLQRRLAHIGQERRRLTISFAEKLDELHDRLLSLLRQRRQLAD